MKLIFVILLSILDSLPGVQIVQDSIMHVLLEEAVNGKHELVEMDGYRVQIYSSNQQQTAKSDDFRTYEEAKEYKKQFVALYPHLMGDTYIVRDKIQVMQ